MDKFNLKEYLKNNPLLKEGYDTEFVDDFISTIFSGYDEEEVNERFYRNEWIQIYGEDDRDFDTIYDLIEKGIIDDPHGEHGISFSIGFDPNETENGDKYIDASNTKYLDIHGRSPENY